MYIYINFCEYYLYIYNPRFYIFTHLLKKIIYIFAQMSTLFYISTWRSQVPCSSAVRDEVETLRLFSGVSSLQAYQSCGILGILNRYMSSRLLAAVSFLTALCARISTYSKPEVRKSLNLSSARLAAIINDKS